ncbi:MAG: hypothetical protein KA149_06410 [Chitinophagales bacterium]|nr:hypothetical protein [Chitinophagales bacterium]
MPRILLIAFCLLVSFVSKAGDTTQIFKGAVSRHALFTNPELSRWFIKEYTAYRPDSKAIAKLQAGFAQNKSVKITMVFGSWCPDSQLELPRFVKVLDAAGFDSTTVTFLAVDRSKTSPDISISHLKVKYVPTAIIYTSTNKGLKEEGRIAEHPDKSYELDLLKVLRRLH